MGHSNERFEIVRRVFEGGLTLENPKTIKIQKERSIFLNEFFERFECEVLVYDIHLPVSLKKRDMEFKKKKNLFISNFMDKKGKIILKK